MTLVNYAYHASVTDSKDFLSKLRTFAIGQGWDGSDYQTSVTWDEVSPYTGWIAGTGDFLQLTSSCYGSCDKAVYRFYAYNGAANEDILYNTAHTTSVYSTNTAIWPTSTGLPSTCQNRWSGYSAMHFTSMPSSVHGIDKVWFFGNDKYIYAVAQYDDYIIPTWHIGTIDLYSEYQSRTDCAFCGWSMWNGDPIDRVWDQHVEDRWFCGILPSFSLSSSEVYAQFDCVYFSGQAQNRYYEGASYSFWHTGGIDASGGNAVGLQRELGRYNFCKNVARTYGPNARRIMFKVDFFARDIQGDNDIVPLGKTPFYVIPFNGLSPGDTIDENGMSYMCFPFNWTYVNRGFAFRIA